MVFLKKSPLKTNIYYVLYKHYQHSYPQFFTLAFYNKPRKKCHKGQLVCAPGGIRTLNDSSEDCCDIHFTTGAVFFIITYIYLLS